MSQLKKRQACMFAVTFAAMVARHACLAAWSFSKAKIHEDEGFTKPELGYFDTSFLLFYALGNFISGSLGDNFPLRFVTSGGMLLAALAYLGVIATQIVFLGFSQQPIFLLYALCFAITGFSQASVWPGGVAVISNWFPKESRGKVMGFWSSNSMVGNIVGQQIAGLMLLFNFRWEVVMLVNCGLLCTTALAFAIFVRDKPSKMVLSLKDPPMLRTEAANTEEGETEAVKQGISFWNAWLLPG